MKKLITAAIILTASQATMAQGLINDMQSCQGLIQFLDDKVGSANYSTSDVKEVREGLKAYDAYIQREIVTPGLLEFNGGDESKVVAMQKQVDDYKATLVAQYDARYPQEQLFMDHAIALNNCAKQAVPAGQELEALKVALTKMVELSQSH